MPGHSTLCTPTSAAYARRGARSSCCCGCGPVWQNGSAQLPAKIGCTSAEKLTGGRVVVVVVLVVVLAPEAQAHATQCPGGAQSASVSHSSPPPLSTTPSPHSERRPAMRFRSFARGATTVPARVSQPGATVALRRTFPPSTLHNGHTAVTRIPIRLAVSLARAGGQA